jgi:mono/diheme cytochrome c family protein
MVRWLTFLALFASSALLFAAPNGAWLKSVPQSERARPNPYAKDGTAVIAGSILYKRDCASCHGDEAQGIGRRPSLRTERVHDATDGDLYWLLTNGSLAHGMPSWSRLPDGQRWQLTRYLHSLSIDTPGSE